MRGLILFAELSKFSSLRNHPGQKWCIKVAAFYMPGHSCLWFRFLEESFLNPVKRLDEVEAGGAGEDAPCGGGGDVGGLGAAAGREEAEEAGARRRESHRRR